MKQTFRSFIATFVAMFIGFVAFAQVTTSTISGKISDAEGTVAGAAVVVTHVPSGTNYYSVTDANGAYRINAVTPGGPYTVSVEMLGYRTVQYTGVYAPLGDVLTINAALEVEALGLDAAVFTADAADSGMKISNAGAGTSVSQKVMTALPTVNRKLTDVMMLTPQSSSNKNGTSLGGGTYRSSFVSVDGAAFQNSFGIGSNLPAGGSPISLDALEQLSINLTPYDVRQSGFTGGAINAVTKSGSNEWHASVYNYFSNDTFVGKKVGDKVLTIPESLDNTTGFTLGGPIIKNKLFFFVNAEYSPETVPYSQLARPSEDVTFDPNNGIYSRPTVEFMNEVRDFLKDNYSYDPGEYQNYSVSVPDWKVMARIDWNINENHKLNARFNHTVTKSTSGPSSSINPMGTLYNRNDYGRISNYAMYFKSSLYGTDSNFTSVAAELNSRFLDGKVNNLFRFTWSHMLEERNHEGAMFPTVDILREYVKPDGSVLTSESTGEPERVVLTSFGMDPFTQGNLREVQTIVATDEVSITKGIHSIVAGAQFEWDLTKNGYMQMGSGYYLYNSWDDFKNNEKPLAFGVTYPNNDSFTQAYPAFTYMQASAYVQDELNISDYFKLTAGLRFELPFYPNVEGNRNAEFAELAKVKGRSIYGLNTDDMPMARVNISPRVGFNWDILKNRNLILRGGTGIYTGRIPFVWIVGAVGNSNCVQGQVMASTLGDDTTMGFHTNVKDMLNDLYDGKLPSKDLPAPQYANIMDKNLRMPSTWKSSLALEGRLPGGIKATLEGIYNKDLSTVAVKYLGIKEVEGGITLPGEPRARTLWQSENIKNSTGANVNPYYLTNSDINGYYYSLTASLQKDFNFGLSAMAAYTYSDSKSINAGFGDQVSGSYTANSYGVDGSNVHELGRSAYVSPHRVIANISYRIKESKFTSTTLGLFYEGMNLTYVGGQYSYNRYSYTMTNKLSNDSGSVSLMYIPTAKELEGMPFSSEDNKAAFEKFISTDKYLSKHRGEYSERGGAVAPWRHTINFKVAQDFNFNVCNKVNTIQVALDINNVANLLNSNWGVVKNLSSESVLSWDAKKSQYTYKAPVWSNLNTTFSTWSMLLSLRYFF